MLATSTHQHQRDTELLAKLDNELATSSQYTALAPEQGCFGVLAHTIFSAGLPTANEYLRSAFLAGDE